MNVFSWWLKERDPKPERKIETENRELNSCEFLQKVLFKSSLIFPEQQSANFSLEGILKGLLICKTWHEWCIYTTCIIGFVHTYGTCYFGNVSPLCSL